MKTLARVQNLTPNPSSGAKPVTDAPALPALPTLPGAGCQMDFSALL
jgi:hypothetical protein